MGLDLSVVKNLKFIGEVDDYSDDERDDMYDNNIHLYENDILFNQSSGMKSGFYAGDYAGDKHVGWSYGGYKNWRNHLIDFIGYTDLDGLEEKIKFIIRDIAIGDVLDENNKIEIPFVEMCYFSDCEGFIGTKVSLKLYKDFVDNRDEYFKFTSYKLKGKSLTVDYYTECYDNLTEYFRIAGKENGAVIFH